MDLANRCLAVYEVVAKRYKVEVDDNGAICV